MDLIAHGIPLLDQPPLTVDPLCERLLSGQHFDILRGKDPATIAQH